MANQRGADIFPLVRSVRLRRSSAGSLFLFFFLSCSPYLSLSPLPPYFSRVFRHHVLSFFLYLVLFFCYFSRLSVPRSARYLYSSTGIVTTAALSPVLPISLLSSYVSQLFLSSLLFLSRIFPYFFSRRGCRPSLFCPFFAFASPFFVYQLLPCSIPFYFPFLDLLSYLYLFIYIPFFFISSSSFCYPMQLSSSLLLHCPIL